MSIAHHTVSSHNNMTVSELRASGLYYAIVPVGTRDEYAANYEGNAFATEEEARSQIPGLVDAFGEGSAADWTVIEVVSATYYLFIDTFNNRVISRHRTLNALVRAEREYWRKFRRYQSAGSYLPTTVRRGYTYDDATDLTDDELETHDDLRSHYEARP